MKAKCILGKTLVSSLTFLFAMSLVSGIAQAENITLIGETGFAPTAVQMSVIPVRFSDEVEKRTNGRVKVKWSFGGALCTGPEIHDAIRKGVLDIGPVLTVYRPGMFPISSKIGLLDFNFLMKDGQVGINTIAYQILKEFPEVEAEFTRLKMKVLALAAPGEYTLFVKKPISKLADLKGLKIRASTEPSQRIVEAGGATPVMTPWGDMITSIQTGLLDGVYTALDALFSVKVTDVAPYVYWLDTYPIYPPCFLCINMDVWKKISAKDQEIITQITKESPIWAGEIINERIEFIRHTYENDPKVTFTVLPKAQRDKWAAACPDFLAELGKELDNKGLPGTKIAIRIKELATKYNAGEWKP